MAGRATICRKVLIVKLLQSKTDGMARVAERYMMILVFGVSLLLLSSIEFLDAIAIVSVVAIQVFLGGLIWRKIRGTAPIEAAEFLGMGGAVGFSLAIISSQFFRETLPRSIAWLVLLVAVYGLCIFVKSASVGDATPIAETENKSKPEYPLSVIFCGTLVALSTSWYWLIPTALVCTGAIVWLLLRETVRSFGAKTFLVYKVALLPLGYYAIQVLIDLTRVETIRNPYWWSLRFGVLQDPDVVFNESMINSVQKFGSSDNIFLAGNPLQYHWLSFAWEATLGSLRDLAPFAVSGIAGPAVVMFVIMALVYALARQLSDSTFSPPATVAVIAMMCSGPIPLFRVLNPYSFSYNFSLIFVFAVLILLGSISTISRSQILLLFMLALIVFGSKSSFLPIIACGSIGLLAFSRLLSPAMKKVSRYLFGSVIAASLLSIAIVLKLFAGTDGSTFRFSFFQILYQKANVNPELPMYAQFLSAICVLLVLGFPILGLIQINRDTIWSPVRLFSLCSGASAFVASLLLTDDLESQIYFLNGGFAVLIPIAISQIRFSTAESHKSKSLIVAFSVSLGLASAWLAKDTYAKTFADTTSAAILSSFSLLIPIIAVFVFVICVAIGRSSKLLSLTSRSLFSLSTILLLSASAGSYLANTGDFLHSSNWASKRDIAAPADLVTGSPDYRELLSWLESNSSENDLAASNRHCSDSTDDARMCSQRLWSLTSAISGRQNLVEGLYPPNSESQSEERDRRMSIVIEFVENPSDENRDSLVEYGVKWVVADHAITNTRDWQPFATERFKNLAGSILELNP